MKKFALTGIAIGHSKSPALFAEAYHHNPAYSYELMPAQTAKEAIRLFREKGLSGMNVTAPFKKDILDFVAVKSAGVQQIGAANTIVLQDGKLCAYNTDVDGVTNSFLKNGIEINAKKAIVLGAGGAGQAAAYALKQAGAEVWWANRTEQKVQELAARYGVYFCPTSLLSEKMADCRLIVNTLPVDADWLQALPLEEHQVVLDADYTNKPLAKLAAAARCNYISGLAWILYQAIPAYFLFTDEKPDELAMRRFLFNHF